MPPPMKPIVSPTSVPVIAPILTAEKEEKEVSEWVGRMTGGEGGYGEVGRTLLEDGGLAAWNSLHLRRRRHCVGIEDERCRGRLKGPSMV